MLTLTFGLSTLAAPLLTCLPSPTSLPGWLQVPAPAERGSQIEQEPLEQEPAERSGIPAGLMEGAIQELAGLGYELDEEPVRVRELLRQDAIPELIAEYERVFSPAFIQMLAQLNRLFRSGTSDVGELRQAVGEFGASQYLAFYKPTDKEMVFLVGDLEGEDRGARATRSLAGGARNQLLEATVLHELVHAWRDQKHDLGAWTAMGEGSRDEALVRACLSEGEAQLVAMAATLARTDAELSSLPVDGPLPLTLGSLALSLPYEFGQRHQLRRWLEGGFEAVRESFDDIPPSTEQVLHAHKFNADLPREVPIPTWPSEALGEAELVHAETLGELMILINLLEAGTPLVDARLAGCGWDGDAIALYRTPKEDVLLWRTVWDRPKDAEQFFEQMNAQARGSGAVRGQVMDWVMARRKRTRTALLEHMGGVEFDVELAEADAMTTELSEAVFEVAPPHVKEGRWVVPAAGISCPAPEGWELAEFNGVALLRAQPEGSFSDSFAATGEVIQVELSIEEAELTARGQFEAMGLEIDGSELVEHGGHTFYELELTGSLGGPRLHWLAIGIIHRGLWITLSATVADERWSEREELVREVLRGIRLL